MDDLTHIPMGIPWDPSLPHSHTHLYAREKDCAVTAKISLPVARSGFLSKLS